MPSKYPLLTLILVFAHTCHLQAQAPADAPLLDSTLYWTVLGDSVGNGIDSTLDRISHYFYDTQSRLSQRLTIGGDRSLLNRQNIEQLPNGGSISTREEWDVLSQAWQYTDRRIFRYSDSGKLIELTLVGFRNGVWDTTLQILNEYDELDRLSKNIGYQTSGIREIIPSYEGDGLLLLADTTYTIDPSGLREIQGFNQYMYDAPGLITFTAHDYDAELMVYRPSRQVRYDYDASGQQIESRSYNYDAGGGDWSLSSRTVSVYDDFGHLILRLGYSDNGTSDTLALITRNEYVVDSDGNRLSEKRACCDPFRDQSLRLNKYNRYGQVVREHNLSYLEGGTFDSMSTVTVHYYGAPPDSTTSAYTDPTLLSDVLVYPNPAQESVNFRSPRVSLSEYRWFTPEGRVIAQGSTESGQIDLPTSSGLSSMLILVLYDKRHNMRSIHPIFRY